LNPQIKQDMKRLGVTEPCLFPTTANKWWLMKYLQRDGCSDQTRFKDGMEPLVGRNWEYRCAACANIYKPGLLFPYRLFVLGEAEEVCLEDGTTYERDDEADEEDEGRERYFYVAFCGCDAKTGNTWPEVENSIHVFKMAELAATLFDIYPDQAQDLAPSYAMIQDAVGILQEETSRRLRTAAQHVIIKACDPMEKTDSTVMKIEYTGPTWSLANPGEDVACLLVDKAKTPTLGKSEWFDIIRYCGAFMDLDQMMTRVQEKYSSKSKTMVAAKQIQEGALRARKEMADNPRYREMIARRAANPRSKY
jgi:hypothetical protein